MDVIQSDGRLRRAVRTFRALQPIDRLLAASTATVVILTILTAAWAATSIGHLVSASPSPRLSNTEQNHV
jgi:hypothetical protein